MGRGEGPKEVKDVKGVADSGTRHGNRTADSHRPSAFRHPSSASVWRGRLIRLRAIEPEDWPVYFAWNEDDEQARGVWRGAIGNRLSAISQTARQLIGTTAKRPPASDEWLIADS